MGVNNLLRAVYAAAPWPGLKLATSWCPSTAPPRHPRRHKKGKGRRVEFRSWSRFLAVSLQVTQVINPAVDCNYFLPGPQIPSQPLRWMLPFRCLVNRGTMGVNSLPKTVTRQRCSCDLNPGSSALESNMITTRLPSHPLETNKPIKI